MLITVRYGTPTPEQLRRPEPRPRLRMQEPGGPGPGCAVAKEREIGMHFPAKLSIGTGALSREDGGA
jgi:hypothetical protein